MKLTFAAGMPVAVAALCMPALAAAAEQAQFVIGSAAPADSEGWTVIDILILNGAADAQDIALPDRITGTVTSDTARTVVLERAPGEPASVSLPARGFAHARYRTMLPASGATAALISVPAWNTPSVALPASPNTPQIAQSAPSRPAPSAEPAATDEATAEGGLLRHISAHEPSFALFGTVKHNELLIQGSFKYRLLGSSRPALSGLQWQDGIYFAYTHKMVFNLASDSSIETDYRPELFYRSPAAGLGDSLHAGIDIGIMHESNGKAGPDSRSVNTVYVSPALLWDLGNDFNLKIAPRYSLLVGGRADNPDIKAYRGNAGLKVQIGQVDGLRLSATGRYNFSTDRGALTTEASYPLSRIFDSASGFYFFGQYFTGYGETLLDYNRSVSRLRFGFGIAR